MYGPDLTFLGVPACDLDDVESFAGRGRGDRRRAASTAAPRTGPAPGSGRCAIRQACYLPHDGSRPSLALRVDALQDLRVLDAGDVEMHSGDIERSLAALEEAVHAVAAAGAIPVVLGGDHSIALPDATGVARAARLRPGVAGALRRARRHRRHRVRLAVRARPADAAADRVRRGTRGPLPADRTARATGRDRPHWTGWPSSGCARTR